MKEKLEIISLVLSIASGVFSVITQTQNIFLPIYYAPEILLALCVIGLMVFAFHLAWATRVEGTPSAKRYRHSGSMRLVGKVLLVLVPISGFALWYVTLRIPSDKKQEMEFYIRSGDRALEFGMSQQALDQYRKALGIDPRRLDVRNKVEQLERQKEGGSR